MSRLNYLFSVVIKVEFVEAHIVEEAVGAFIAISIIVLSLKFPIKPDSFN